MSALSGSQLPDAAKESANSVTQAAPEAHAVTASLAVRQNAQCDDARCPDDEGCQQELDWHGEEPSDRQNKTAGHAHEDCDPHPWAEVPLVQWRHAHEITVRARWAFPADSGIVRMAAAHAICG